LHHARVWNEQLEKQVGDGDADSRTRALEAADKWPWPYGAPWMALSARE
jgi:hypothetical protein